MGLSDFANMLDMALISCPDCGGQLRSEIEVEWRPLADVCEIYATSAADLKAAGVHVNALGLAKCGITYVTCMDCGMHANATVERAR